MAVVKTIKMTFLLDDLPPPPPPPPPFFFDAPVFRFDLGGGRRRPLLDELAAALLPLAALDREAGASGTSSSSQSSD